jgi:hypothetical protein
MKLNQNNQITTIMSIPIRTDCASSFVSGSIIIGLNILGIVRYSFLFQMVFHYRGTIEGMELPHRIVLR